MDLKKEKQIRNKYLLEVYKAAKKEYSSSPTSVFSDFHGHDHTT